MPELPEVETVARDLRPPDHRRDDRRRDDLLGADPARPRPEAFADGVAGRRIESVGRRAKQIVVELSGGAFLTIHLKMTGPAVRRPAGRSRGSLRPARAQLLEDGREIRFRDIRKFGKIGLYVAADDAGRTRSRRSGRSRSPTRSRSARSGAGSAPARAA